MYIRTNKHTIASVSIYIFALLSCIQVECKLKKLISQGVAQLHTFSFLLLGHHSPGWNLFPFLLTDPPCPGLRDAWPNAESSPSRRRPGLQTLLLDPYVTSLLDCGRPCAMAVALLVSERNYKKIMLKGSIL